jgi:hypothetical protein
MPGGTDGQNAEAKGGSNKKATHGILLQDVRRRMMGLGARRDQGRITAIPGQIVTSRKPGGGGHQRIRGCLPPAASVQSASVGTSPCQGVVSVVVQAEGHGIPDSADPRFRTGSMADDPRASTGPGHAWKQSSISSAWRHRCRSSWSTAMAALCRVTNRYFHPLPNTNRIARINCQTP